MRRKTVVIGVSYLCGLFLASFLSPALSVAVILVSTALSLVLISIYSEIAGYIIASAISFCVAVMLYVSFTVNTADKLLAHDGNELELQGRVLDIEHLEGDMLLFTLEARLEGIKTKISFVSNDTHSIDYDDTVTVIATMERIYDSLYFQSEEYNRSRGIFLSGGFAQITDVKKNGFSIRKAVLSYRDYLCEAIMLSSSDEVGSFLAAMLCGDRSSVTGRTGQVLSRTGLSHIFSVSGLHLVIVVLMVMQVLRLVGAGRVTGFVISELFIIAFTLFAGCSASVMRAALMTTLHNFSALSKRRYDPLSSLILACVILTALEPYAIRSSSLLLSGAGAFSMAVASPKVISILKLKAPFYKTKCTVVSLCVLNVLMFPLSVVFFPEVSVIAVVANFLLVPLCSAALCMSAVVAILGALPIVAKPLLMAAGAIVRIVLCIAQPLADLKLSSIPLGYTSLKLSLAAIIAVTAGLVILRRRADAVAVIICLCGYILCLVMSAVNFGFVGKALRMYCLTDGDSRMIIAVNGTQCIAVNVSGDGDISKAVPTLLQEKGVREICAFYDLAQSTTAYVSFCENTYLQGVICNCDFDGFLSAWIYDDGLVIEYQKTDIFISPCEIYDNSYDVTISGDILTDYNDNKSFALYNEAELIYIDGENTTVRRLPYGFDE